MDKTKRFPMLDGPDIDWETAEKIYDLYSYKYGVGQTLERIAERGGFGWYEVRELQTWKNRYKKS